MIRSGFTLLEIVFTIAIFAILVGLALPVGLNSYQHYLLGSEVSTFVNLLRRSQSYALGNVNSSGHGIAVQSGQYVIFQGATYASRNATYDESYSRSTGITITGPSEIDFSAISGNPNASSTFVFSNTVGSRSISINDEGTINW